MSSSELSKTYYEVLGVKKDCTQKEIRDAYVELCKQLHPDVKGATPSSRDHSKFTELNHAYTVLSRPLDRKHYDDTLQHPGYHTAQGVVWRPSAARYEDPFMHRQGKESEHYKTPRYEDFAEEFKKQRMYHQRSKMYVVLGCLILIFSGACLHYAAFRYGSSNEMKSRMQEKNRQNWAQYHQSKSDFKKYGMEGQMERLLGYRPEAKENGSSGSHED
ncbi:uncharacterized protein LOC144133275 isoform X2 [Amblyomma americanum]